jgi:hypothetical protein
MSDPRISLPPSTVLPDDRRGLVRYAFQLDVFCRAVGASAKEACRAKVSNVSQYGLGLVIPKPFAVGGVLSVEIADTPQSLPGSLLVRVVNARLMEQGQWLHGCAFVSHGRGDDMQAAFRVKLDRPPGRERRRMLRYPLNVPAVGRALTASLKDNWNGTTQDISAGGLRIASSAPVDAGTLLTIKVQTADKAAARSLMARVMHAAATDTGWNLGCVFPSRLSPDELGVLLKEGWARGHVASADPTATLKLALANQIERNALDDARRTIAELLKIFPKDPDALAAREFLVTLAMPTPPPMPAVVAPPPAARPAAGGNKVFGRHKSSVNTVAFCGDGRYVLTGGGVDDPLMQNEADYIVRFWDLLSGMEIHGYTGHHAPVIGVAVARRGSRAVSASRCGTVFLWDVERRQVIRQFEKVAGGLNCIAISSQGRWVLGGGDDGVLRLWDADLSRCTRRYRGHEGPITSCAFLPNDHVGVSGGKDQTVRLWNLDSTYKSDTLKAHTKAVLCVAASADGRRVASGSADNTIRTWDVITKVPARTFEGHANVVNAVAFSPDGRSILSASADNSIRQWDIATARETACFSGHSQSVKCVCYAPDGSRFLSGSSDQEVRVWELPGAR